MNETIDQQINAWIREAGIVLSKPGAKIIVTVVEMPSELAYARFFARTAAAGLTVITSRPPAAKTFPQTLHLLTLKTANEMSFCGASLDTSEMTPKQFLAEIVKSERGMPVGRPMNFNLAVSSNNVKAMAEQVAVLVEKYGDRFKASRQPTVPMDDAREVTWLMSIANAEQQAAIATRHNLVQPQPPQPIVVAPPPPMSPPTLNGGNDVSISVEAMAFDAVEH